MIMKVGIYTHYLDKYPASAPSLYQVNLIKNLSKFRNIELILIHHKKSNLEVYKNFEDATVSRTPFLRESEINALHLDIIHFNSIPWSWGLFVKRLRCKKVATVHGDIWWVEPQLIDTTYQKITGMLKRIAEPYVVKYLDRVIAVSNSLKNTLQWYLKYPEEKIRVIYEGIDHSIFYPRSNEEVKACKAKYKIDKPYILHVSNFLRVKNPDTLFKAFKLVKREISEIILVTAGNGWLEKYGNKLNQYGLNKKDVKFLGWVNKIDLPALYTGARVFFYPSYKETFGFPNLEAMACGCPVVTSNRYAIPEVVGNAAILHEPDDYLAFADSIIQLLTDEILRKRLVKKGMKRARKFSWEKNAYETLIVYKEVLEDG